ncbi:glutamate-rich protein 2 [Hydra vulgaris]|uniref:Glutamate-rich protein 2 n=1 Tax=Hydra vulgaris TaxID=6087 RepID=A0ABM4CSQ9_HYDVU
MLNVPEETPVELSDNHKIAPMEVSAQFLFAVMNKDYRVAQKLCDKLLELEPENKICQDFKEVLLNSSLLDDSDESSNEDITTEDDTDSSSFDEVDHDEEESDSNEDDESESDSSEEDSSDDELTVEEVNKLNLVIGGLKVK